MGCKIKNSFIDCFDNTFTVYLAWECLLSSSAWRSGHINIKINLFCSLSHQAELSEAFPNWSLGTRYKSLPTFMKKTLLLILLILLTACSKSEKVFNKLPADAVL
jgi:hypothetical protein